MAMNWADWAIVAIIGFSVLISLVRGFIREALSLVVWVCAFVAASMFYVKGGAWFDAVIPTPSLRYITAWVVIFAGVLIAGAIVNFLIGQLVKSTGLGGTDRLLGMVFGALRGGIIVLALLILVPGVVPVTEDPWWHESLLIPHFLRFENWAVDTTHQILTFFQSLF
ncbi:MAG: CvpA family protein [Porticoccaceae bacterium]|jgi:membrane protein required for colicin V production|nr:CvpA family protein [Porticoccaceae bacterium]MEA3300042.1 CvpA family protein [Pseudomonadota bacterium]HLS97443.1 CvpA family protein [Porticoccaceae bacterium]